jgi:predicted MPP superfamily phosphohydrolase
VVDDRLVISRGLANNGWIPRLNNPPELVYVEGEG